MKTLSLFLFIQLFVFHVFARNDKGKFTSENIDASTVPEVVKKSHESFYAGVSVNQWKKNTLLTKKGETFIKFSL